MEIRINLVLLTALATAWAFLSAGRPAAAFDPHAAETQELAFLEDALAAEPSNELLAAHVMGRYLDLGRPGLAIGVARSVPGLTQDPMVAHRLAQAYEASDRPLDALATARLARMRCGQAALPTDEASSARGCGTSSYAALDMHETALERMVEWGVASTSRDPRVRTAYALAVRRATVAIAE